MYKYRIPMASNTNVTDPFEDHDDDSNTLPDSDAETVEDYDTNNTDDGPHPFEDYDSFKREALRLKLS